MKMDRDKVFVAETAEKPAGEITAEKPPGEITIIAPDGILISASSYKELAEKIQAYRDSR
jgi:hypothetical protein